MNYFFKKIILWVAVSIVTVSFGFAAEITISAPERAVSNRQPIVVQLFLDTKEDTLSGISGDFSFPSDLFTVSDITLEGSAVSLWVKQPHISEEKYFDNRTHIPFEGIFPGGYSGVRSPYYQGKKPGVIFSVVLVPNNKGKGSFVADDITFYQYNEKATHTVSDAIAKEITVPELIALPKTSSSQMEAIMRVDNPSLNAFITRDPLVNNNAWHLIIYEQDRKSIVEKILVAETGEPKIESVKENMWRSAQSPYTLLYQNGTKYTHIKIRYVNNTYTTITLPPVENSLSIFTISRILVGIIIVLTLVYVYGKNFITLFKKQAQKQH